MILNRVAVRNWRGLTTTDLQEFSPNITLITGNNEAGKTRLAEAMWFALFESSKGSAQYKKELATWGSSEVPEVELAFSQNGVTYEVHKRFLSPKVQTTLAGAGQTLQGEDAERALAELLKVQAPTSRAASSDALHWWPFLWVRQFEAGSPPQDSLNESARATLIDTLATQVGEIAAGPGGHALLEQAQSMCREHWTPTGQPSTTYKAVAAAHGKAQEELETIEAEHAAIESDIARLAELDTQLAGIAAQVDATAGVLREARSRAQKAQAIQGDVNQQEIEAKLARSKLENLRKELITRKEREASLQAVLKEIGQTQKALAAHGEAQANRNKETDQATETLNAAIEVEKAADEQLRRARRQRQRATLAEEVQRLRVTLERIREFKEGIARVTKECGAIVLTERGLASLEDTHQARAAAQAQLRGASTRVELEALKPLSIQGGPRLAAGETHSVPCTEPSEVVLQDCAVVRIYPGGDALAELQEQLGKLDRDWEDLLARFNVTSLEDAKALWIRRTDLVRDGRERKDQIKHLCPEGTETLEQRVEQKTGALEQLGADDPAAPDEDGAQQQADAASEVVTNARTRAAAVQKAASDQSAVGVKLEERLSGQEENAVGLRRLLGQMSPSDELARCVEADNALYETQLATLSGLKRQYSELGGDDAVTDVDRLQKSLASQEDEKKRLEKEQLELATRLEITAGTDIHGRLQEALAAERAARVKLERTNRWASAHKQLVQVLERARQASQRRLLAPAIEGIRPYLHHIFPGADISMSESLEIEGLQSDNQLEAMDALSGGTREQVGAMVRLGLGGLFARDEPLPLVFDDAFTNSDSGRIGQVQRILYQAAQTNLQLIVLTCHPERFTGLGEEVRINLPGSTIR